MLIDKIKLKKPLNRLDDSFVNYYLEEFLKRNQKLSIKLSKNILKKSEEKIIIKNVRSKLNRVYGQFWLDGFHKSANERKEFYNELYLRVFKITKKPKIVIDIASGFNAFSYDKDIYYIATELTEYDCDLLRNYFKKNFIKGEVIKNNLLENTPIVKADVCFLFKILDSFDHKTAERIVKEVNSKYLVVSFATKTLDGRKMNYPRRGWFEIMLKRNEFTFEKLLFENEIFYVVKK